MFEKHQKVTWYKIFCVYKRKIGTEKPKKRLTSTNEMNQKFKNLPTPLAARGAAGGACQRKNYKQRGGKKHSSPSRCLGLAGPQFWTLASSLFRKQRCGPKDSVRPSLSSCLGLASF